MKRNNLPRLRMALLLVAFVVCAAVLGTLILRKYEMSRMKPPPPPQTGQAGVLLVTLFFASPDGSGLVREAREIDACTEPADCAREVVEELINGPLGELSETLPPATTVNAVRLDGDTAMVDLGREFAEGLAVGSNAEIMAVYAVTNSLAYNFNQVKQVQFLLGGANVKTLRHLDIGSPLPPDFNLEKKQ